MIARLLGSMVRGSGSALNLFLSCVLGALIGFVPGAADHPGLVAIYAALLFVLNANLLVALLVALPAKLAAMALIGTSFDLGRSLVDGPLRGLVQASVEAPVLAFLDLDVYAVTGGMVIAVGLGVVVALVLLALVAGFRSRYGALEVGGDAYRQAGPPLTARLTAFLLVGARRPGTTYAQALSGGLDMLRPVGVAVVVVVGLAMWLVPSFMGQLMTATARGELEQVNGATVDLDALALALFDGKLEVQGLAMADREALDTDMLRTVNVTADASVTDLLRGRMALDTLVVSGGRQGVKRDVPGVLVSRPGDAAPPPPPPPSTGEKGIVDATIEALFEDGEVILERLRQAKELLDTMSEGSAGEQGPVFDEGMTVEERIAAEIEAFGHGRVRAPGLRREAPSFLLRELVVDGLQAMALGDEMIDIRATSLSSAPSLLAEGPSVKASSRDGTLDLQMGLGGPTRPAEENRLKFSLRGLSGDTIGAMLGGGKLSGGTVDLLLDGGWLDNQVGQLDLPLTITLRDTVVDVVGGPRQVGELTLPFRLRGSLANPRISWEGQALTDALLSQAEAELRALADEKKAELEAKLGEKQAELQGQVDAKAAELEAQKQEALEKQKADLKKKVGGALGGLLGGDDGE